jgi:membrane protein implicated in regulation of membrane protease activity
VIVMQSWLIWLSIAAVLGVAELLTATFDLLMLAVAALAAAGVGALGFGLGLQFAAFVITAAVMITLVRPVARRHLTAAPQLRSGVAALIGREAVVLSPVGREAGRVRIGGEEWTARAYDPDLQIPAGTTVDVFAIEGATALVHPREEPWPNSSSG